MCLNRFYLAQGVKLYSQETWRMTFPPSTSGRRSGVEAVAGCAGAICRFYVKMCDADNHVVREVSFSFAPLTNGGGGEARGRLSPLGDRG